MLKPEALARETIDEALRLAGWILQDVKTADVDAGPGVVVREFPLGRYGFADYLLYVHGKAAGVIEAKPLGVPLTGVELQTDRYSKGLPPALPAHVRPLPFLYQSTGEETRFTNLLDPEPRSRHVFHFHRPETLAEWLEADRLLLPLKHGKPDPRSERPATLRGRIQQLPTLRTEGLWPAQVTAIRNLETSLAEDRPRALLQMATGSGKTFTAVNSIYRLIKYGGARRVLFLVDRANLGDQALKEFQQFDVPEGNYKFTQEFNVQHLKSTRSAAGLPEGAEPSAGEVKKAAERMLKAAVAPLARNPTLRQEFLTLRQRFERTIDAISKDRVLEAGYSPEAKEKAKVESFEQFLKEEQDRIIAEIERRMSLADKIEAQLDSSMGRAPRLAQSILCSAFEGKLVAQTGTDEPAERLMERLSQEASLNKATSEPEKPKRTARGGRS